MPEPYKAPETLISEFLQSEVSNAAGSTPPEVSNEAGSTPIQPVPTEEVSLEERIKKITENMLDFVANHLMVERQEGKLVVNTQTIIEIYKYSYEIAWEKMDEKRKRKQESQSFGSDEINPEIIKNLKLIFASKDFQLNFDTQDFGDLIEAFNSHRFEITEADIANYKEWRCANLSRGNETIVDSLVGYCDAIKNASVPYFTGQITIESFIKRYERLATIYTNDTESSQNRKNEMEKVFDVILQRLGSDIGLGEEVLDQLKENEQLVVKLRDTYKNQYDSMLSCLTTQLARVTHKLEKYEAIIEAKIKTQKELIDAETKKQIDAIDAKVKVQIDSLPFKVTLGMIDENEVEEQKKLIHEEAERKKRMLNADADTKKSTVYDREAEKILALSFKTLKAQQIALTRVKASLETPMNDMKKQSHGKEENTLNEMIAYRSALKNAYGNLTGPTYIKIAPAFMKKKGGLTNLRVIQSNKSRIANIFNGVINQLARLVGKRRPQTFLTKVNLWIEKRKANTRVLRAANKAHVEVLAKRFGLKQ